jgi:Skp family chaperone for outer membrane proteins
MSFTSAVKCLAVVVALALGMSAAPALAASPAVILVVDTQGVFAQSKAGQNMRSQFEEQMKKLVAEGKKTEEGLQADATKLTEERALLAQDDFVKRAEALQKRGGEFQQSYQMKQSALQLGLQRAEARVESTLRPIFAEILKEKGATILFDQAVVLAGGADMDISAEVLKRLNERLPTVEVKPLTEAEMQAMQKANGQ